MKYIMVRELNFYYNSDEIIFRDASLQIRPGEIICIVGDNGSGKSTFLKILSNIIPCEMKLDFLDMENTSVSKVIKDIGYVPDKPFLYEELTGQENINYMTYVFKENKNIFPERVRMFCDQFNISDVLRSKVKNYSLGMKHKLFLACIMSREIKLLLLDEPLTAMDQDSQKIAIQKIKELSNKGTAVIFTSHIEQIQNVLATKIYSISDGKFIIKSDSKEEVFNGKTNKSELREILI